MDDFYRAKEDDTQVYHRVCAGESDDIVEHASGPAGMSRALGALECKGDIPSEWRKRQQEYVKKFTMAKKCLQRRLTTMKKYGATTELNRSHRLEHIFPIQYAYAYGKGCLKRFASPAHQAAFKKSVDDLILSVSSTPRTTDIQSYFLDETGRKVDIDESIQYGKNPTIKTILDARISYNAKEKERNTVHSQAEIAAAWAADARQIADKWIAATTAAEDAIKSKRGKVSYTELQKLERRANQIRHDAERLLSEAITAEREADRLRINASSKPNTRNLSETAATKQPLKNVTQLRHEVLKAPPASQSGWGRMRRRKTRKNSTARRNRR